MHYHKMIQGVNIDMQLKWYLYICLLYVAALMQILEHFRSQSKSTDVGDNHT